MKEIKLSFIEAGKCFVNAMGHLAEALFLSVIYIVALGYHFMNGRFFKYRLEKPYRTVWRVITWGIFVWGVLTYVCVPFFAWWDKAMQFIGNLIWG